MRVTPIFEEQSVGAPVIVKYGSLAQIAQEQRNFEAIFPFVKSHKLTVLEATALGRHLGAVAYSLVGASDDRIRSFGAFYSSAGIRDIETALRSLFQETCVLWYASDNRCQPQESTLSELYEGYLNFDHRKISVAFQLKYPDKPVVFPTIDFPGVARRFRHPIAAYCDMKMRMTRTTWQCRTHGDLHGGNVLVDDSTCDTWLIDFGRTGVGHWARDFAALEAAIRFQHAPANDLVSLFEFEDAVMSIERLGEKVPFHRADQPELTKAAEAVSIIRGLAAEMCDVDDDKATAIDYFGSLFYHTINYMRFHALIKNPIRRSHVLLSAALVYESLRRLGGVEP